MPHLRKLVSSEGKIYAGTSGITNADGRHAEELEKARHTLSNQTWSRCAPSLTSYELEKGIAEKGVKKARRARTKWISNRVLPQKFNAELPRYGISASDPNTAAAR